MGKLTTKSSSDITKRASSQLNPNRNKQVQIHKDYPVQRKLNKGMLFFVVLLMAASFQIGMHWKSSAIVKKLSFTSTTIEAPSNKVQYKEIVFENYINELNNVKVNNYREYLTEASRIKTKFRRDMGYNSDIFVATHHITGADQAKYDEFNYNQSKVKNKFYDLLDKHREVAKRELRIKNNVRKLVQN